ncbi:MAG: hypothetical protein FJ279_27600, partial [Planctomycetes bacterium]|nr:hypothetical protein [Planctomycetota bacterium]
MLVLSVGAVLLSARAGLCEPNRAKVIADFEGETKFSTDGATAKPATFVTALTASQGRRSLRFVYSGEGADRATIGFPVPDGAQGFNAVAFDLYCEKNNGSSLVVSLRQEVTEPGKAARYTAAVNLSDVMGGWNPVRFVLGAGLVFKQDGGVEPDWSRIRSIN